MSERRVWIAQCVCPDRHCIIAAANEADRAPEAIELLDQLQDVLRDALAAEVLNPWCGLCGAEQNTWLYDLERTRFPTLEAAAPELLRLETEQAAVRAAWGDMKRSD